MKFSKRILMCLLAVGTLVVLVTSNGINANDTEIQNENELEQTKKVMNDEEVAVDEPTEEVSIDKNSASGASTMSEPITPYAITDSVFNDSSRPLEQAIIAKYGAIDNDGDGYISASEAAAYTGQIVLNSAGLTGTMGGIENFTQMTALNLRDNSLTGTIPTGIENLTGLTSLLLDRNQLTGVIPSNIGNLVNLTNLYLYDNNLTGSIPSSIGDLVNVNTLFLYSNELSGVIPTTIGNMSSLKVLRLYDNNLSGSIPTTIGNATNITEINVAMNNLSGTIPSSIGTLSGLTRFRVQQNPLLGGELPASLTNLSSLTDLYYSHTSISSTDLSGLANLTILRVTKSTNANLGNITNLFISGSREYGEGYVSVIGPAGILGWDSTTGYYVVNPGTGATYNHYLFYVDVDGNVKSNTSTVVDLNQGGLLDDEGNLIIGATPSDVQADGSIYLPNGGSFVTGDKTYIFGGEVTITGSEAVTSDSYTIESHVNDDGNITIANEVIQVGVNAGSEVVVDLTKDGTTTLPAGTILDTANGDKVYVVDGGLMTTDGVITPNDAMITVPSGSVSTITTSGNEDTLPAGTSVTIDGETVTYPGTIKIDTVDNTVTYLPVDSLLDETGTGLANGVTQQDIDDALAFVNTITPGALQDELLTKVESAQKMMNAKKEAEGLLNSSQDDLANGINQGDITNAGTIVGDLVDGPFKDVLQSLVEKAQTILDAITSVNDLYNNDKSDLVVDATQDMIDNAQKAVDKLDPTTDRAKELQKLIDDAQTILDNRKAATDAVGNLFNDKKDNLATDVTQDDIKVAQDLVNKLPDGDYKDILQKEINTAQNMLDAKNAVNDLLDKDGNLNSGVTQEDINNAQNMVNKLPDGELKDELQLIINEAQKQLDKLNGKPSTAPTVVKPSVTPNTSVTNNSTVNTGDMTDTTTLWTLLLLSAGYLTIRKLKTR